MKRLKLLSIAALMVTFFWTLGCTHATSRSSPRSYATSRPVTYALAISVHGGLQPTPGQWAALQAKFSKDLAASGQILVTDLALADRIIRVDFFPNENDPENSGRATVVSIRTNSMRGISSASSPAYASAGRYPTSFGFGGSFLDSFHSLSHGSSYYGYGHSYHDGYSYGTPTLNPRKPVPPTPVTPPAHPTHPGHPTYPGHRHHPHPGDPVRCPPLLAAALPSLTAPEPTSYPPREGRHVSFTGDFRPASDRTYAMAHRGDRTAPGSTRNDTGSTSAPPTDRSASWVSRFLGRSDSSDSNSSNTRTYSRSGRAYSSNDSGFSRSDSNYSRAESNYSSSSYSPPPTSYSAPSYSPPPPSYSPPPASYSAPSYSPPPPSPSSSEVSTTTSER